MQRLRAETNFGVFEEYKGSQAVLEPNEGGRESGGHTMKVMSVL